MGGNTLLLKQYLRIARMDHWVKWACDEATVAELIEMKKST